jgi:hypothetical protein
MALKDQVKALIDAGADEHEIKQALRKVMDERQLTEHSATLPNIPTIPPVMWANLKARLLAPGGPTNVYEMLTRLHNALDADDQPAFWRALFGLTKAVWANHPGHRRVNMGPTP